MTAETTRSVAKSSTPITLYYQPAFFSSFVPSTRPDSPTPEFDITPEIKLWIRHPALHWYIPDRATSVNLLHTPNLCDPNHVEIDDHVHQYGCTSFGPNFPQAYASGGVYLSESLLKKAVLNDLGICDPTTIIDLTQVPVDETLQVHWPMPGVGPSSKEPIRYHGFFGQQLTKGKYENLWVIWHPGTWRDLISKIPEGTQWRAPRKLWIPDSVVPDSAFFSKTEIGDISHSIYLEQKYVIQIANLDVPKQPSGSGEGVILLITAAAANSATLPQRDGSTSGVAVMGGSATIHPSNLNVIGDQPSGEMWSIKKNVQPQVTIAEGKTLADALSEYFVKISNECAANNKPLPSFDNLDLIGHSRARDRVLKLGELALTSRVAKVEFSRLAESGILRALKIKTVRLLGCRTASHPRGRHAARVIHKHTGLKVYATRTDLFAVHYNGTGLRPEAEALLADYEVIAGSGPGDIPPTDDYPGELIPDDDDDHEDPVIPDVPEPDPFSLAALSTVNAAMVSAHSYLFWECTPGRLDALGKLLYADWSERDNPLLRAEYEVLLPISDHATATSDFRSFDLFLTGDRPRLRVNKSGVSYAFFFQCPQTVYTDLCGIGIHVVPPKPDPQSGGR